MPLASDTHGRPLSSFKSTELPELPGVNKNTNWLSSRGAWAFYVGLILALWLLISLFVDPGLAWTWVHVIHGVVSFYLLHWVKARCIPRNITAALLHSTSNAGEIYHCICYAVPIFQRFQF